MVARAASSPAWRRSSLSRARAISLPDLSERDDELGDLARSLEAMTDALWEAGYSVILGLTGTRDWDVSTMDGNRIVLNMPSNITFRTDQDAIMPGFYPTLNSVAIVLRKFNRTLVDVDGYTDSTGGDSYNLALSQRRGQSVASYLEAQGIDGRRFAVQGFGKADPVATNATEAGRAQNRRLEIFLTPITQG